MLLFRRYYVTYLKYRKKNVKIQLQCDSEAGLGSGSALVRIPAYVPRNRIDVKCCIRIRVRILNTVFSIGKFSLRETKR
jgi:hypothetical protein